jgi:hypothetical protein
VIWLGVNCRHTGSISLFSFEGGTKPTVFICKFTLTYLSIDRLVKQKLCTHSSSN